MGILSKRWVQATIIVLLLIVVVSANAIPTPLTTVSLEDGAWQFTAKTSSLKVNGVVQNLGTLSQMNLDADGALSEYSNVGWLPEIHAGLGMLRPSGVDPVEVSGYMAYTYEFDVMIKTIADRHGMWYESALANIEFRFDLVLQEGIFNETPDAMIAEAWISDYSRGLSADANLDWSDIRELFETGADPAKNVDPEVVTSTQSGESLITGGTTQTASCMIGVSLRAGGLMQWSSLLGLLYISGVTVFNVFALYTVTVEVLIEQPPDDGGGDDPSDPPIIINPFVVFLQPLADLTIPIRTWFASLGVWGYVIVVAVVVIILWFFLIRKKRR